MFFWIDFRRVQFYSSRFVVNATVRRRTCLDLSVFSLLSISNWYRVIFKKTIYWLWGFLFCRVIQTKWSCNHRHMPNFRKLRPIKYQWILCNPTILSTTCANKNTHIQINNNTNLWNSAMCTEQVGHVKCAETGCMHECGASSLPKQNRSLMSTQHPKWFCSHGPNVLCQCRG
jgi:hypothetical protein